MQPLRPEQRNQQSVHMSIWMLYIICGLTWSLWEIHAYFTLDNETIKMLNNLPGNTKVPVIVISVIIAGVIVTASWPIEVPTAMYQLHKRNK